MVIELADRRQSAVARQQQWHRMARRAAAAAAAAGAACAAAEPVAPRGRVVLGVLLRIGPHARVAHQVRAQQPRRAWPMQQNVRAVGRSSVRRRCLERAQPVP